MYYVYILYNRTIDKYYVGYTGNIKQRIEDHRRGKTKRHYTKNQRGEGELVYKEEYKTQKEAKSREKEIKSKKSKRYIEMLLSADSSIG